VIHWVPESRPTAVRGFVCASQSDAEKLCAAQEQFDISMTLTQIRKGVVVLAQLKAGCGVKMLRPDILRLASRLRAIGITDVYFERKDGRLGPFAEMVTTGPLKGMYHFDVIAVLAGADGDY